MTVCPAQTVLSDRWTGTCGLEQGWSVTGVPAHSLPVCGLICGGFLRLLTSMLLHVHVNKLIVFVDCSAYFYRGQFLRSLCFFLKWHRFRSMTTAFVACMMCFILQFILWMTNCRLLLAFAHHRDTLHPSPYTHW